ncbi:hypothetical protein DW1_2805 [Proteiniborus sp. DW1]|uniref:FG-GAP repeat domain-containing protein n=1 Tax=Proteiniborus sp. DW1 TaxID=1889883 RepID=UPI00092DF498|nr:VCBS repeat-containing protein [Proteiniborus sp. DW1]SCG84365.1 hypothetical protein DW1_2805 [Proteiniborus sp. DW1]
MKIKFLLLICILLILSGCSSKQPEKLEDIKQAIDQTVGNITSEVSEKALNQGKPVFDESQKEEHVISSETSKVITFSCGNNARLDIAFSEGSVENERIFEVSPISSSFIGKNNYAGFYLTEKGTTGSVEVNAPVTICYMTTDEIPEDVRIVKYGEEGEEDIVVPGYRIKTKEGNGLMAFVNSFSGYGVKKVSKGQIARMADMLEKYGFDWVLDVDDHYKIMLPDGTETMLQCRVLMENTTSPYFYSMQGTYNGQAKLGLYGAKDVGLEIEGFNLPLIFGLMYGDDNASFKLIPVFEEYDTIGGTGVPLVSLIPKGYVGKGMFQLVLDGLEYMGGEHESEDDEAEPIPFTVFTRGPIAYLNIHYYGLGYMKFQGSIVGHAKKTEKELPTPIGEIELVPLTQDVPLSEYKPDDNTVDINNDDKPDVSVDDSPGNEIKFDNNGDGKADITIRESDDGGIEYDMDGDGKPDITIYPLI